MFLDLYVAALAHLLGHIVFGHFEAQTAIARKLTKVAFLQGITALLSYYFGHWSLLWVVGMYVLGLTFHFWWTRKHGINPLSAEPKAKYYALRGWSM
jgi:hypothetical protein